MRRKLVIAALVLLVGLALARIGLGVSFRRMAVVAYLSIGDLWAGEAAGRGVAGGMVVFDAAQEEDRRALVTTHGDLQVRLAGGGKAIVLTTGSDAELHEVCTRRVPRDWSGFNAVRLEYAAVEAGVLPPRVVLRIRNRPDWRITRWYYPSFFLEPRTSSREIGLASARQFIDRRQVRQLCLALKLKGKQSRASLTLRRVVLQKDWTEPVPPAIDDVSLTVIDDSNKLRRFDPLPPMRKTFHAARNEVVAFQLVLRRGTTGPGAARIELDPFQGADGRTLHHELFEERTLLVREPSSIMFGSGSPGPGTYPDPLVPLATEFRHTRSAPQGREDPELTLWHGNRMVWVDVHVPADAAPGRYATRVRARLGDKVLEQDLELRVHPLTLAGDNRQLVMVYYLPQLVQEALGVKGDTYHRLEAAYQRLFQAHGTYLVYDTHIENLGRFLPAMKGTLYTEGPGKGRGAPYWPVGMRLDSRAAAQQDAVAIIKWFDKHALRTQPFVYLFDEPSSREDYELVREKAAWIHEAPAPGNRLPVMVTEQVTPEDPSWPSLVGSVDYWISPLNFPEPARTRRKTTRERFFPYFAGEPICGADVIDTDGVSFRTWGWIAFIHEVDVWFHWQGLYFRDKYNKGERQDPVPRAPAGRRAGPRAPDGALRDAAAAREVKQRDPYRDAVTYDQRRHGKDVEFGNGSGTLAYPPARPDGPPVASLRLKLIRRGMQDRLLLLAASACGKGQEARQIARRLVPRSLGAAVGQVTAWPKVSSSWVEARIELLQLLARCQ